MEIFENRAAWTEEFESGWLDHLNRTSEPDWKQYHYARNRTRIEAPGIDPTQTRLMLVSTAGAYLRESQKAFDTANPYGDYTIRVFPSGTAYQDLDYSHEHYDHSARRQDPRVNLPLSYLADMTAAGELGGVCDKAASFSGYMPDANAVFERIVPEVLRLAEMEQAQSALLVPV